MTFGANFSSFSQNLYNNFICKSPSKTIYEKICFRNAGYFGIYLETTRNEMILKAFVAKISLFSLTCLAIIESVARVSLALISLFFSWLTFFTPSISHFAYNLSKNFLVPSNGIEDGSFAVINDTIYSLFFC
jgi:hypothetical protein